MADGSHLELAENTAWTARVVARARADERDRLVGGDGVLDVPLERPARAVADRREGERRVAAAPAAVAALRALRRAVAALRAEAVPPEPRVEGLGEPRVRRARAAARGLLAQHAQERRVAAQQARVVRGRVALGLGEERLVEVELAAVRRAVALGAQPVAERRRRVAERGRVVEDARRLEVQARVRRRAARRARRRRRHERREADRARAQRLARGQRGRERERVREPVPRELLVRHEQHDVRRPRRPRAPPPRAPPARARAPRERERDRRERGRRRDEHCAPPHLVGAADLGRRHRNEDPSL